jgi:hypothetical protein
VSECQSIKSIKSGVKWRTLLRNKWRPLQRNRGDLCSGMGGVLCVGIVATFAAEYPLLTDKTYVVKILSDFDYYEPKKSIIVSLWKMSNEEVKKELYSIFIKKLETKFDSELYREASYQKMIDFNLFFETYLQEINVIGADLDYEFRDGKPKLNNFLFSNALLFIYKMEVKSNDKRLNVFGTISEQVQFFLFRDKSDLSKFKIEWLYLIDWDIIYTELSKIKPLKKIIESALKDKYEEKLSNIYTKFFI